MMSDRATFGFRLRHAREQRGISLDSIAAQTNVSVELWDAMERNDFSRWPAGVFARAFIRAYADAVGLDREEVVDEFCRLFPLGDRRAERLVRGQAEVIGIESRWQDDLARARREGDRRADGSRGGDTPRLLRNVKSSRAVAASVDLAAVVLTSACVSLLLHSGFWTTLALTSLAYHGVSLLLLGRSAGTAATELFHHRVPSGASLRQRRAHA